MNLDYSVFRSEEWVESAASMHSSINSPMHSGQVNNNSSGVIHSYVNIVDRSDGEEKPALPARRKTMIHWLIGNLTWTSIKCMYMKISVILADLHPFSTPSSCCNSEGGGGGICKNNSGWVQCMHFSVYNVNRKPFPIQKLCLLPGIDSALSPRPSGKVAARTGTRYYLTQ